MSQPSFRFPAQYRLRSPNDFRKTFDRKCSVSDDWLIVYGCPNDLSHCRLGLSVSRKVGNAVRRNRLRRLYKEAFRLSQHDLPPGLDLILIPRNRPGFPTLDQLKQSLPRLAAKVSRRLEVKKPKGDDRAG
jgi:ribonuclease P protein component